MVRRRTKHSKQLLNHSTTQLPNHQSTDSLRGLTIGFIGAGTMGQALIKGLRRQGVPVSRLCAVEASPVRAREVARQLRMPVSSDIAAVAQRADLLVLAVKPQQFPQIMKALAPHVTKQQLVISIAAGITLRWLRARLPKSPLIRVMPNLPATVGEGFSAIAAGRRATAAHRRTARELFSAVGSVVELPERYLDAITAVSGSGPAYVFYLAQAWETAAQALGLPKTVAREAIRTTLQGSVRLLQASGEPANVLVSRVASKGGTTEAALKELDRRQVRAAFVQALGAAARRSRELSWI